MATLAGLFIVGISVPTGMALGAISAVGIAMIGSLTVLPALLAWLGPKADAGRIPFLGRTGRTTCVVHGDPNPGNIRMTADRVAMIDWDESHADVPDLDLALPHNAAGLGSDAYDIAVDLVGVPWPVISDELSRAPNGG
jgi:hypothetical protein